jgi:N-methylhydantoinase A
VAFGGAGPAHAVEMAREFGINKVIVPVGPGLFSTLGLLVADVQEQDVVSYRNRSDIDAAEIHRIFKSMEERLLQRMAGQGHPRDHVEVSHYADMRYAGQSYELRILLPSLRNGEVQTPEVRERFEIEHEKTYGHRGAPGQQVEIVNLRLKAVYHRKSWNPFASARVSQGGPATERDAYFGPLLGRMRTPVIERVQLPMKPIEGPLIVEDMDGTTVVPPRSRASRDGWGNIIVEVQRSE